MLTEEAISAAIDTISGYIVSKVAAETNKSVEEITEIFLTSNTYALLSDAGTGYYWDNIFDLIDMFKEECFEKR
jgi:16S rRNA C1402 (ribose-2'-O) methylase RsmI